MIWAVRFLFSILFLFGAFPQNAWSDPPPSELVAPPSEVDFLLSGPPVTVTRALKNLNEELHRPQPRFQPKSVSIALEVWDVSELLGTASDHPERVAEESALRQSQAELEETLGRRLALRNRRLSSEDTAAFQEKIADTADLLWPLYEKLGIREIPVEPAFVSRRGVLWKSVTNPLNLAKGVARFLALSYLIGYDFTHNAHYTPEQSAVLATVAASLSFCLMAGVDFYDKMVVSPFWLKIPTPEYWLALDKDPNRRTFGHGVKKATKAFTKDFLVYATYLSIFTYASIRMGVASNSWTEIILNFLKTAALGIASETTIRAAIAEAKTRAVINSDMSDPAVFKRRERRILNIAASASFLQSIILTPLEMSAALGRTGSQLALASLSAFGASTYVIFLSSPHSRLGSFRDQQLVPAISGFFSRLAGGVSRGVSATCQFLTSALRP